MPNLLLHGKGKVPQNLMLCQSVSVKYHRPMQIIEMIEHDDIWNCPSLGVEFDNRLDKSCRQPGLPWIRGQAQNYYNFLAVRARCNAGQWQQELQPGQNP